MDVAAANGWNDAPVVVYDAGWHDDRAAELQISYFIAKSRFIDEPTGGAFVLGRCAVHTTSSPFAATEGLQLPV